VRVKFKHKVISILNLKKDHEKVIMINKKNTQITIICIRMTILYIRMTKKYSIATISKIEKTDNVV